MTIARTVTIHPGFAVPPAVVADMMRAADLLGCVVIAWAIGFACTIIACL